MHRNRLMALLAANQAKPKRYDIEAKDDVATIYLYDTIDPYWGVSAKQFVKDLNALKNPTIHLRINSPGGDVFDGRAIATAIAQHPSKIVAHVDGLAASAASYVAIAAKEVEMSPGSFLMIHKAWTLAYGNSEDLTATAAILEKIDETLVQDYAKKTGATAEQVKEWLAAETWFTAEEAVAEGFADRVSESDSAQNTTEKKWDLAAFVAAPAVASADEDEALEAQHAERKRRASFLLDIA
jgi:ATP-dependent Clp protease protease subunit